MSAARSQVAARLSPADTGVGGAANRSVSWFAPASLGLQFMATLALAPALGLRQLPYDVALFVLPLLFALPPTRAPLIRRRWLVLGAQALFSLVPLFVFGSKWAPGAAFGWLFALGLLLLSGWAAWLLAGTVVATELILRLTVTGLPFPGPTWLNVTAIPIYTVVTGTGFYVLVRLAQLVGQVEGARRQSAGVAMMRERLAAAAALQVAVDHRLVEVAATAAAARRVLSTDPSEARHRVAAAAVAAREAVSQARTLGYDGAAPSAPAAPGLVRPQSAIGARLAWAVLVVTLLAEGIENSAYVFGTHDRVPTIVCAVAAIVAVVVLQLHHSRPRWKGRPPAWRLTITLETALVFVGFLPWVHAYAGAMAGFAAGTVLLLVPGWHRWLWSSAVIVSFATLSVYELPGQWGIPDGQQVPYLIYLIGLEARVALMVYAMARLVALALQLEALHPVLTRLAAARERLRIARDVHDLLGLGLSAIALKSDLVTRLIDRGDLDRAAHEIAELERTCASTRADLPAVTGDGPPLSLRTEIAAARPVLSGAGIGMRIDVDAQLLSPRADAVLATVVREAVTNILRHASASVCAIELVADGQGVVLRVSNDGVPTDPAIAARCGATPPGKGLVNLTGRVQDAGGHLATDRIADRFVLTVALPPAPILGRVEPADRITAAAVDLLDQGRAGAIR